MPRNALLRGPRPVCGGASVSDADDHEISSNCRSSLRRCDGALTRSRARVSVGAARSGVRSRPRSHLDDRTAAAVGTAVVGSLRRSTSAHGRRPRVLRIQLRCATRQPRRPLGCGRDRHIPRTAAARPLSPTYPLVTAAMIGDARHHRAVHGPSGSANAGSRRSAAIHSRAADRCIRGKFAGGNQAKAGTRVVANWAQIECARPRRMPRRIAYRITGTGLRDRMIAHRTCSTRPSDAPEHRNSPATSTEHGQTRSTSAASAPASPT